VGLLDDIFQSSGAGGGILDFLRNNALNQQYGSGLQSDQAQYGQPAMQAMAQAPAPMFQANQRPSPLDNAQFPQGPVGAPSQANAQMAPQQPPQVIQAQPPQPSGPGFFDRLNSGLQSVGNGGSIIGALTGNQTDPVSQQRQVLNQTFQALVQKGVDPVTAQAAIGNPELLKTIIQQTYGPKTVTSLGSGYVADRNGNISRAYEPDDKIPVGFQKTDKGLQPIPGGPADPAYLRSKAVGETDPNAVKVLGKGGELYKNGPDGPVILHRNEDSTPEATLDDGTVKAMAAQYLAGDKSVLQNLGRGAQGAANIVKIRQEITHQAEGAGLNAKDIVNNFNEQAGNLAGQRSIGTRAANISLAANEANNMIPIALKASDAVPRGDWMPWNKMMQAYQAGNSSPELARFVAATNSLVNAYVRAVSPSGVPTDSMREHAYSMLNSAQSPTAYKAVTSIMQDEMKAALQAPEQVRKELRKEDKPAETPTGAPKAGDYIWMPGKGLVPKS
jgi:hypothetical protein